MKPIEDIFPLLHEAKRIVIVPHQKPDADAMGASLALSHFLKQFGHSITIISPSNWAGWLNWMPGCNEVIDYDMFKEKAEKILTKLNGFFVLTLMHPPYKKPGGKTRAAYLPKNFNRSSPAT